MKYLFWNVNYSLNKQKYKIPDPENPTKEIEKKINS
jgi:hypothetical protein